MPSNDEVLNAAVANVNKPKEPIAPKVPEAKKDVPPPAKPPIEDIPEEKPQPKPEPKQANLFPSEKKKFKVKGYGKETEIEVGDDDLPDLVQKGYSATEKWKQAQDALRQAEKIDQRNKEFAESFKKDPEKAMELILGRESLDTMSEKRIMRIIEMEKMSPEQRELYQINERIERAKKEESEILAKKQEKENMEKISFFQAKFKDMTTTALKKIGFETPSRLIQNRFLLTMRPFLSNSNEQVTPEDLDILATHFKKSIDEENHEHYSKMDGQTLAAHLGQENVEKIRKYLLNGHQVSQPKRQEQTKEVPKEPGRLRDYINNL